jgi:hypothetical protein
LFLIQRRLLQQFQHPNHTVHRRPNFVAHRCQKICLGPCRIFSGAVTSQFGEGTVSQYTNWGPEAGWYVTIASLILSVALCVSLATLRFPIPFDTDDSSGEAL